MKEGPRGPWPVYRLGGTVPSQLLEGITLFCLLVLFNWHKIDVKYMKFLSGEHGYNKTEYELRQNPLSI